MLRDAGGMTLTTGCGLDLVNQPSLSPSREDHRSLPRAANSNREQISLYPTAFI